MVEQPCLGRTSDTDLGPCIPAALCAICLKPVYGVVVLPADVVEALCEKWKKHVGTPTMTTVRRLCADELERVLKEKE